MADNIIVTKQRNSVISHPDGSVTLVSNTGQYYHFYETSTRADGQLNAIAGGMVNVDGRTANVLLQDLGDRIVIDVDAGRAGGSAHIEMDDKGKYSGTMTYPWGLPRPIPQGLIPPISSIRFTDPDAIASAISAALTPPRRDPLAIDLDRDGIETVGFDAGAPLLFDHNADGVRTGTGWLKADDAWLVLDRNGNGLIDSGRELFGNDTLVTAAGVTRTAASGFEALANLDTGSGTAGSPGHGDGIFDARDAAWSRVRLWQDLNQDGISQGGELSTLAAKGIVTISLQPQAVALPLGNTGNSITGRAVVGFTGGSSTEADSVAVSSTAAGNLVLASNPLYRLFTDQIPHTERAQALPQMPGSGLVRDLREALSLGNTAAEGLDTAIGMYAAATTRGGQLALLDGLIHAWGATSTMATSVQTSTASASGNAGPTAVQAWAAAHPADYARITTLERFNGTPILALWVQPSGSGHAVAATQPRMDLANAAWNALRTSVYEALVLQTRLAPYIESVVMVIGDQQLHADTTALQARLDVLKTQDPANAFIDLVELNRYAWDFLDQMRFDGLGLLRTWMAALPAGSAIRITLAGLDVFTGSAAAGTARGDIYLAPAASSSFAGLAGDDRLDGAAGDDTLKGGDGDDVLRGGAGRDLLSGDANDDVLDGGTGNDTLQGGEGEDLYLGGSGNDTFEDLSAASSDIYEFLPGSGSDRILDTGGASDRVTLDVGVAIESVRSTGVDIVLKLAGGQAIVLQSQVNPDGSMDTAHRIETVSLADGTLWDQARLRAEALKTTASNDAIMAFETADTIDAGAGDDTVNGFAGDDLLRGGAGADALAGGTGQDRLQGEGGNDALFGGDGEDLLDGGEGNDQLRGDAGRDLLLGGAGSDTLDGGEGDDMLSSGTGNDVVADSSASSNDTYYRAVGDGIDSISDGGGASDRLVLKAGVSVASVRSDSVNLVIGFADGGRVTLANQLRPDGSPETGHRIEQVVLADGSVWDQARLRVEALKPTSADDMIQAFDGKDTVDGGGGNDSISGHAGNDLLYGGAGRDFLSGGAGDDVLDGGADADSIVGGEGSDFLQGGAGNDTLGGDGGNDLLLGDAGDDLLQGGLGNDRYLFDRGWGRDRLVDADAGAGNQDRIDFGAGIAPEQIWLTRSGNDLAIQVLGSTDRLSIENWFAGDAYHVETFRTASGRTLSDDGADILVSTMARLGPPPADANLPPAYQQALAPVLAACWT